MKYFYVFVLIVILISCNEKKGYSQFYINVVDKENNNKYLTR